MSKANVIFSFEGIDINIHCSSEDKLKNICEKFAFKIERNINSLVFLYGGNQLNLDSRFKDQANSLDKFNNLMRILVYQKDIDNFTCPKCGEKIQLDKKKIDDIVSSNNNIKDIISGIKIQIENIIKVRLKDFNT